MKADASPDVTNGELDAADANRRDAYRVADRTGLTVRTLAPAEFGALARTLWRRREGGAAPGAPARPSAQKLEMLERVQPEVHAWIVHLEVRLEILDAAAATSGQGGGAVGSDDDAATSPGTDAGGEVDLSEGGIGFRLDAAPEPGTLVALTLALSTLEAPLELVGEIVRSAEAPAADAGVRVSARFREMHPGDRDALVGHIFAVQREGLRRRRAG